MADNNTALVLNTDLNLNLRKFDRDVAALSKRASKSFTLNINDNASLPLGRISASAKEFDKSLNAATQRVVSFGAALAVLNVVQAGFAKLVTSSIEVQDSLAKINVNLGQSTEQLKVFSNEVFKAAKEAGTTFESAAKGAEELARQGLSAQETVKRLRDVLILSRVAGIDSTSAVESLTAAVNSFAGEAVSTTDILNKFVAVDTKFAVSTKDLQEAISRVGSTATEAGVSLDELNGIVTAVQQTTARGGATIGNAFKTIFTRLGRPEVLNQLEDLGVSVKDVSGNALPAIQILKNLAAAQDTLSESQKRKIKQDVAGVFQINILNAALKDLGKAYGIAERAQDASANATNEAFQKNAELNKTVKSQLNSLSQSFTQLFSKIGEAGLNDKAGGFLKNLTSGLESLSGANGEGAGKEIGDGIIKGIANVLSGPGLIAAVGVILKTVSLISRAVSSDLKGLLDINGANQQRLQTQQQLDSLLSKATAEERENLAVVTSIAEKKTAILAIQRRISAEEKFSNASSEQLTKAVLNSPGFPTRKGIIPNLANGYTPIANETRAISNGIGGASVSAKPVIIPNFNFGGGKQGPIVANSSEYLVPNYANGGSAIFNPNMVRAMGLPAGAQKINAAGGLIPNYANGNLISRGLTEYLDSGAYGDVNKLSGRDVVTKRFRGANNYYNLAAEFITNRLLAKKGSIEGLNFVNPIGSYDRSVKRGYFGKPFVENAMGLTYANAKRNPIKEYIALIVKRLADSKVRSLFGDDVVTPDTHAGNFGFNSKAAKIIASIGRDDRPQEQTERIVNTLSKVYNKPSRATTFINKIGKAGGRFDVYDAVAPRFHQDTLEEFKIRGGFADGYVPKSNSLKEAILREIAAGVNARDIYVDKDARLRSQSNPLGLLVANSKDEPMGGKQGVDRAIAMGRDPKKHGSGHIPNFADTREKIRILTGRGEESRFASKAQLDAIGAALNLYKNALTQAAQGLTEQAKENKKAAKTILSSVGIKGGAAKLIDQVNVDFANARKAEIEAIKLKTKQGREDIQNQKKQEQENKIKNAKPTAIFGLSNPKPSTNNGTYTGPTEEQRRAADEAVKNFQNTQNINQARAALAKELSDKRISDTLKDIGSGRLPVSSKDLELTKTTVKRQAQLQIFGSEEFSALSGKQRGEIARGGGQKDLQRLYKFRLDGALANFKNAIEIAEKNALAQSNLENFGKASSILESNSGLKARFSKFGKGLTAIDIFGGGRSRDEGLLKGSNIDTKNPDIQTLLQDRDNKRQARRGTVALGLSFAAPFLAGFVGEGQGGSNNGVVRGGIAGALNGAGTGGALGSFIPGIGTGAGLAIGAGLGALSGIIDKLNKSAEDYQKELEALSDKENQRISSISGYIQIQEQLNDIIKNAGDTGNTRGLKAAQRQKDIAYNQLTSEDKRALEGKTTDEAQEYLSQKSQKAAQKLGGQNLVGIINSIGSDFFDSREAVLQGQAERAQQGRFGGGINPNAYQDGLDSDRINTIAQNFSSALSSEDLAKINPRFKELSQKGNANPTSTGVKEAQDLINELAKTNEPLKKLKVTYSNYNELILGLAKASQQGVRDLRISKEEAAKILEQTANGIKTKRLSYGAGGSLTDNFEPLSNFGSSLRGSLLRNQNPRNSAQVNQNFLGALGGLGQLGILDDQGKLDPNLGFSESEFKDFDKQLEQFKKRATGISSQQKTLNAAIDLLKSAGIQGNFNDNTGKPIASAVTSGLSSLSKSSNPELSTISKIISQVIKVQTEEVNKVNPRLNQGKITAFAPNVSRGLINTIPSLLPYSNKITRGDVQFDKPINDSRIAFGKKDFSIDTKFNAAEAARGKSIKKDESKPKDSTKALTSEELIKKQEDVATRYEKIVSDFNKGIITFSKGIHLVLDIPDSVPAKLDKETSDKILALITKTASLDSKVSAIEGKPKPPIIQGKTY